MRKNMSLILLISLFCSCAVAVMNFRDTNRQNILRLSVGMNKKEVVAVMGNKQIKNIILGTISNPYRSEIFKSKEKSFEVWYYYTDRKIANNILDDEELTPVVFEGGKTIGWGYGFFQELVRKYEIRIR